MIRPALVTTLALVFAGCGADVRNVDADNAATASASDARVGSGGVTVELPTGWQTANWDDGNVTDPRTRLVVASARIRVNGSACQVARYDFAADAVALDG
jgi:hypothetical protein